MSKRRRARDETFRQMVNRNIAEQRMKNSLNVAEKRSEDKCVQRVVLDPDGNHMVVTEDQWKLHQEGRLFVPSTYSGVPPEPQKVRWSTASKPDSWEVSTDDELAMAEWRRRVADGSYERAKAGTSGTSQNTETEDAWSPAEISHRWVMGSQYEQAYINLKPVGNTSSLVDKLKSKDGRLNAANKQIVERDDWIRVLTNRLSNVIDRVRIGGGEFSQVVLGRLQRPDYHGARTFRDYELGALGRVRECAECGGTGGRNFCDEEIGDPSNGIEETCPTCLGTGMDVDFLIWGQDREPPF